MRAAYIDAYPENVQSAVFQHEQSARRRALLAQF